MKPAEAKIIVDALKRFENQLSVLNDFMRLREERIILLQPPRLLEFVAADVGQWVKIANTNQYRYEFAVMRTAAAGILYIAPGRMERTTQGIPLGANESYPTTRDRHIGEVWVNPDAATIVAIYLEWIRTPLTPRSIS